MDKRKLISILDQHGTQIGSFYAPVSPISVSKYTEAIAKLKHSLAALNCLDISPCGKTFNKNGKKLLAKTEKRIYELFDELLGYDGAARPFFNTTRPFAKVKGKFYCDQCLLMVKQYVDFEEKKNEQ